VDICPESVLAVDDGQLTLANPKACTYCGVCEETCPEVAVRLEYVIRWA
jgi:NAD-dependent dihydropyrimidine dehydrogenase PreA subunit